MQRLRSLVRGQASKGADERRDTMLRRFTASLIVLGLTATYLSPIALGAAPAPKKNDSAPKRNAKFAPEFDNAAGSSQQVRVIIQTNGRPNAAHDSAINSKGGSKGTTF